jgi:hypothetical protein
MAIQVYRPQKKDNTPDILGTLGSIAGAVGGFLVGGPPGAMAGASIGGGAGKSAGSLLKQGGPDLEGTVQGAMHVGQTAMGPAPSGADGMSYGLEALKRRVYQRPKGPSLGVNTDLGF